MQTDGSVRHRSALGKQLAGGGETEGRGTCYIKSRQLLTFSESPGVDRNIPKPWRRRGRARRNRARRTASKVCKPGKPGKLAKPDNLSMKG